MGDRAADSGALARAARDRGVPLTRLDLPDGAARELYGPGLVLVRPDGHVAWRGARPPADPGALLDRVTGHGRREAFR
ncbi:FAD-monooxygenase [Streptomyces sp. HCCB10043]|nr:FAD-monooxygenase [Streptomyces sp. HCCB10043]